jgi:hypothetical protein
MSARHAEVTFGPRERLLVSLERVIAIFPEATFKQLRDSLVDRPAPAIPPGPERPGNRGPENRLNEERRALSAALVPEPGRTLIGIDPQGRMCAVGRVDIGNGLQPRLAVILPNDYPGSAPQVFAFSEAGPVQLPLDFAGGWRAEDTSARAIQVATDFLRRRLAARATGRSDGNDAE